MSVILGSTGITFPDSTTQTTAATASAPPPWVLLSTVTASGASTMDIESTFSSTYDYYKIIIPELYQSYASYGMLAVRLKMGGSYQSGANSYNQIYFIVSDGTSFQRVQSYDSWVNIAGNAGVYVGNQANGKSSVEITIFSPTSTTAFKHLESNVIYGGVGGGQITPHRVSNAFNYIGTGYGNDSSSTLSGVRIYEYSGGLLTGTARLYGLKNS